MKLNFALWIREYRHTAQVNKGTFPLFGSIHLIVIQSILISLRLSTEVIDAFHMYSRTADWPVVSVLSRKALLIIQGYIILFCHDVVSYF